MAVDVSSAYAVLGLMGPRSRELLATLTDTDLASAAFPFATSRIIDLGYARVRASRITYVGELGYELYIPTEFAQSVYDVIVSAGPAFGLQLAGYHALNSLRIEKAYRHWGHDICATRTPRSRRGCSSPSPGTSRAASSAARRCSCSAPAGVRRRLVALALERADRLLYHNEPIWRDGELVGRICSGMFAHTIGTALGLGYVARGDGPADADVDCGRPLRGGGRRRAPGGTRVVAAVLRSGG